MPAALPSVPAVVAHADWGCDPRKRQLAVARLTAPVVAPRYEVVSLAPAPDDLFAGLDFLGLDFFGLDPPGLDSAGLGLGVVGGSRGCLVGFDFPIGLPRAYADAAGVAAFPPFLDLIGSPPWQDFSRVAEQAIEISLARPFYPQRPGGTSRADLARGLGLASADLRRRADGTDAETLFWTLGGKQAGKAALHGWRLLRQARSDGLALALWPFDGSLGALLAGPASFVVAETYPREFYRYIGAPPRARWSKRRQADRLECIPALLEWARALAVSWDPAIRRRAEAGFAAGPTGEDEFDSVVGVLGMIAVVTGTIAAGPPPGDPALATTEGWILGRAG
jgi:hypothetical protein